MSKHLRNIFVCLLLIDIFASACQATPAATVTQIPTPAPVTFTPAPAPVIPTRSLVPATPSPTSAPPPEALWSFQTQGAIWGTPSVSGGTVYFGSDDGNLYAVNAQTGRLIWKFATLGIVRSQPAVAGGLVYFASDDGYVYAVDAQKGLQAWRPEIGDALARQAREKLGTDAENHAGWDYKQSSPVVAEGQIYVGSLDGSVYALAADIGHVTWTYKTGGKVRATPVVTDGTLYVGSWDKSFYALDALTGEMRWKTPVGGELQSTALVAKGLVYTASRKASVVALEAQTGALKWEFSYGPNMWVESSPVLANGMIYIGSSGSKIVVGLDSQTGKQFTLFHATAWHWSTPAVVGNMLYIGGTSFKTEEDIGGLFGLGLVGGGFAKMALSQWHFPVGKTLEAEGNWSGVASSPFVVNGIIYFGGLDGELYAVHTAP
jgi:outer membrane protein assembly factor BamB